MNSRVLDIYKTQMTSSRERLNDGGVLSLGSLAPQTKVLNEAGEEVEIKSLWATRPVLLTFLRHYG